MITFAFLPPKELSAWLEKAQKDQLTAALTFLEDENPKKSGLTKRQQKFGTKYGS